LQTTVPIALCPLEDFVLPPLNEFVTKFLTFISNELTPRQVNTLILRVDFNYEYKTHPELRDSNALTSEAVKQLAQVCRKNNIRIIPQVNLLGHQSWASRTNNLLRVYPQFDETPGCVDAIDGVGCWVLDVVMKVRSLSATSSARALAAVEV
jgi:hypothetical protein